MSSKSRLKLHFETGPRCLAREIGTVFVLGLYMTFCFLPGVQNLSNRLYHSATCCTPSLIPTFPFLLLPFSLPLSSLNLSSSLSHAVQPSILILVSLPGTLSSLLFSSPPSLTPSLYLPLSLSPFPLSHSFPPSLFSHYLPQHISPILRPHIPSCNQYPGHMSHGKIHDINTWKCQTQTQCS